MKKATNLPLYLWLFTIAVCLALAGGWIANIVKMIGSPEWGTSLSGMLIARVVGIFIAPLGGVLGYF